VLHFDASTAECLVFTYKEGLLAAVAHDLKIRVTAFTISADEATRHIEARFDAHSLRVVGAVSGDRVLSEVLSTANKREIEANIVRDVLRADTYPEIHFVSKAVLETTTRDGGKVYTLRGRLSLHGHERMVNVRVRDNGAAFVGDCRLHQPDFGIQPYSALLGALRIKPGVTIRVTLPKPQPTSAGDA
jgi:hypothetical protein